MDYDSKNTGGTAFLIIFPEFSGLPDIEESYRRDSQDVHRLEMIAILEAMEALAKWIKKNSDVSLNCSRIVIHTDRYSLSGEELLNPYKIAEWKRKGWKNHEGKPVKHKDLIGPIQKIRKKLGDLLYAKVQIVYIKRKFNKRADKLSKRGKISELRGRKLIVEPQPKIAKRLYDGDEINYKDLSAGDELEIRIYKKDSVQKEYEISAEISDGDQFGKKIKIYVDFMLETKFHRHHFYIIMIKDVYKHHVKIRDDFEEITKESEEQNP